MSQTEAYGNILDHKGPYSTIQDPMEEGACGTRGDHTEPTGP